jgi:hypothetical protein
LLAPLLSVFSLATESTFAEGYRPSISGVSGLIFLIFFITIFWRLCSHILMVKNFHVCCYLQNFGDVRLAQANKQLGDQWKQLPDNQKVPIYVQSVDLCSN